MIYYMFQIRNHMKFYEPEIEIKNTKLKLRVNSELLSINKYKYLKEGSIFEYYIH